MNQPRSVDPLARAFAALREMCDALEALGSHDLAVWSALERVEDALHQARERLAAGEPLPEEGRIQRLRQLNLED